MARKRVRRTGRASRRSRAGRNSKPRVSVVSMYERKRKLAVKNLIWFAVLFILSFVLYLSTSQNSVLYSFFWILSIITGFVLMAFIIVYLVLVFMKVLRK